MTPPIQAGEKEKGEEHEQHEDAHSGHQMHEGAITFTGQGQTHKATVLGGVVGKDTVESILVGVFVLQAESPDRLKPDGSGPTHIFNVTFADEQTEEMIQQARGSVTVIGADGRQRNETFNPFASHFQARLRLDQPGDYLVRVDFETAGRTGTTKSFPFAYRRKSDTAGQEGHEGHEGHGDGHH
jgi:hypothetical protein